MTSGDAHTLREAFVAGERSATEIVRAALAAAAADNLGSLWHVFDERALGRAAELDSARAAGEPAGALAAVPFVAKDCFAVAGITTSCGIAGERVLDVPVEDGDAVASLEAAGAVLIGKTCMDQLAWGMNGGSPGFPPTRNPADPTRMPGGSSGGSAAAVAGGIVPLALGTDAGGSVRQPAAWCGIVGFKPTLGAISTGGCAPMTPSLDTVGTFSRTIADQQLALEALAPDDTLDAPAQAPGAPRIGVIESAFTDVDPAVADACENALRRWEAAGATLVALELPWVRRGLASVFSAELASFWTTVVDPADGRLLPTVRAGLERGGEVDAVSYVRAIDALRQVRQEAAAAVEDLDLVAGPTSPIVAQPLGDPDPTAVAGRNTRVFNGLGWPAISIPVAGEPLPIGLQLAAAAGHDGRLLDLARELTHPGRD